MASRYSSGKSVILASMETSLLDDDDSSLQDSWIDLGEPPSPGGTSTTNTTAHSDPGLLIDAQGSLVHSTRSPKSLQSPNVEFNETLEAVKYKLTRGKRNVDWMYDEYDSRPEVDPPTEFRFRHPGTSNASTPPPPKKYDMDIPGPPLSLRHSKWISRDWFSVEILSVFLVSNVVTFVLGVCVGVFVLRRCCPPQFDPPPY